ncbi:MAG: hypothetical protein JXB85_02320 [Anaerolineales bacterium]|nr:hypothetical protein [Anaerolineales bacterium]
MFSERRQQEIAEVVERLARFGPTRVAIERTQGQQGQVDGDYRAYLRGEFELSADEIHQLGFRLGRRLGHEGVYCVNAWGRYYDPPVDCETYLLEHSVQEANDLLAAHTPEAYARAHGQEHLLSQWWPYYQRQCEEEDAQIDRRTLREILAISNAEENAWKSHGPYLVDGFKVGEGHAYPGADWVTAWYNRNLRIFANLQRITTAQDERILLIIGGGHVAILRHCVLASPEYDLVEVCDYLGAE